MQIPELTFSDIQRANRRTNWDLKFLLYKGGAKAHTSHVNKMIASGQLGNPIRNRLSLVINIHQFIHRFLVEGGSAFTADNHIRFIRYMFVWAEESKVTLTLQTLKDVYLAWTDQLYSIGVIKRLNKKSIYTYAAHVGFVVDRVLERPNPIISLTKLKAPDTRKSALNVKAEKQNLEDTFLFGHFLQDVCDALTVETVLRGHLPVRIELRSGEVLIEPSGCSATDIKTIKKYESEGTLKTRYSLSNRRCEAELLMFIAQTGMNFSQAIALTLKSFTYASYLDGYLVRERKARRGGMYFLKSIKNTNPILSVI